MVSLNRANIDSLSHPMKTCSVPSKMLHTPGL